MGHCGLQGVNESHLDSRSTVGGPRYNNFDANSSWKFLNSYSIASSPKATAKSAPTIDKPLIQCNKTKPYSQNGEITFRHAASEGSL